MVIRNWVLAATGPSTWIYQRSKNVRGVFCSRQPKRSWQRYFVAIRRVGYLTNTWSLASWKQTTVTCLSSHSGFKERFVCLTHANSLSSCARSSSCLSSLLRISTTSECFLMRASTKRWNPMWPGSSRVDQKSSRISLQCERVLKAFLNQPLDQDLHTILTTSVKDLFQSSETWTKKQQILDFKLTHQPSC